MNKYILMILFVVGLVAGTSLPAHAVDYIQYFNLTASDIDGGDYFGKSVAINGNIAIVGAPRNDDACPSFSSCDSGSAYLIDATTGSQLLKLTANDAEASDHFGHSVAISGNIAIVGAEPYNIGSVYIFDATTGNQLFKLTANDAENADHFGYSVAISGNIAIVGAYGNDDDGVNSGSAYIFDVTTGNQLFKLTANDAEFADYFGYSVAISGNIAIVGAYRDDDASYPFSDSGSAYLFDVITGNQIGKLTAGASGAWFGYSVAIDGNIAIVGAYRDEEDTYGDIAGSAYLFDVTTSSQLAKLRASDALSYDNFGKSVAISGNIAIVGAPGNDDAGSSSGSAYIFDVTTGNQLSKFTASDAGGNNQFGNSVGISNDISIAGAHFNNSIFGLYSGSAYLFSHDSDSDSVVDIYDNCLYMANPSQIDSDEDGIGDICECDSANIDGVNPVNIKDFAYLSTNWLLTGSDQTGDTNRDEIVDISDLLQLVQHWLSNCN